MCSVHVMATALRASVLCMNRSINPGDGEELHRRTLLGVGVLLQGMSVVGVVRIVSHRRSSIVFCGDCTPSSRHLPQRDYDFVVFIVDASLVFAATPGTTLTTMHHALQIW